MSHPRSVSRKSPSRPTRIESGYADVGGARLYYEATGEGPPLVLIHAGFLDRRMWEREFVLWSRRFRVLRYDVRGYGKSDRPSSSFSSAEDLARLLDQLGIDCASVIGVSIGGEIAIDFTLLHPDRVTALVPVASSLSGYTPSTAAERKVWDAFRKERAPVVAASQRGDPEAAVDGMLSLFCRAQAAPSLRRIQRIAMDNAHIYASDPDDLQVSLQPPASGRLAEIRAPTLIVEGDQDVAIMRFIGEWLRAHISGSRRVMIRGADHIVNVSKPAEFERHVLRFLNVQ